MRLALLAPVVCLLFVACGEAPREAPVLRGQPPSVVWGAEGELEGGQIVVGLLVPRPPSTRLVDWIPAAEWEAFQRRPFPDETGGDLEAIEEIDVPAAWRDETERRHVQAALAAVAKRVFETQAVRVLWRSVLASECAEVPLVLSEGPVAFEADRTDLEAYVAAGGALHADAADPLPVGVNTPGVWPRTVDGAGTLTELVLDTLERSALVHRLATDPLAVVEARREGDDVLVRFGDATAEASLRSLEDDVLETASVEAGGVLRVRAPDPALDPYTHRVVATWTQGDLSLRRAWSVADLVGTAEAHLYATTGLEAGSAYAPRIVFRHTLTGEPVAGREATVRLMQGERELATATGRSDATGNVPLVLAVPADAKPTWAYLHGAEARYYVRIHSGVRLHVTTDRRLYRPTDSVHVRVMALRAGDGTPVEGLRVTVKAPNGDQRVTTSAHGIASATFPLREARVGPTSVHVTGGGAEASTLVHIRAFETPTFLIEAEPASLELERFEMAPVAITARYVNGSPMVGAKVTLDAVPGAVEPLAGVTDEAGRFAFQLKRVKDLLRGGVEITVEDADGRRASRVVPVQARSSASATRLEVVALDEPVVGRPCLMEIRGIEGGVVDVRVGDGAEIEHGVGIETSVRITVVPTGEDTVIHLASADGTESEHVVQALLPTPERPLLRPARRTATVGETLPIEILAPDGPVYVDVARDVSTHGLSTARAVIRALAVVAVDGVATLDLDLTPDLAGLLTLRAWRLGEQRLPGSACRILVTRDRALDVEAAPSADAYRPGEIAFVDVSVKDRQGAPTACVLGYWGVDEAVLAVEPWSTPSEAVFDVLGRETYGTHNLARRVERGFDIDRSAARKRLGSITSSEDMGYLLKERGRDGPVRRQRLKEAAHERANRALEASQAAFLAAFEKVPLESLRTGQSLTEVLAWIVARGDLDPALLLDPWGTPWALAGPNHPGYRTFDSRDGRLLVESEWNWGAPCTSAGPDLSPETPDDEVVLWAPIFPEDAGGRLGAFLQLVAAHAPDGLDQLGGWPVFFGPTNNGLIGIGGGAGGAFAGRGGSRSIGGGHGDFMSRRRPTLHVREDFDPTLCFVPQAIVGPEGTTRLEIPLKDAITTWRLRLVATAGDGATGTTETGIRVWQPLHIEPWIATHLTVGDAVDVPVAVRNETDAATTVFLKLGFRDLLQPIVDDEATVEVAPRGTAAHVFLVRANAPGTTTLRIDARSSSGEDAVVRTIHVARAGRPVVETTGATLKPSTPWTAALPVLASSVEAVGRVTVHASPLSEVVSGFEGLIGEPHGCFEQTSATLHPMVLALHYLNRTQQSDDALATRAMKHIEKGYERLLSFEVDKEPGGFSLFGDPPARIFLTAYGLMEFADIQAVQPVDASLLERIVAFLRAEMRADGSWASDWRTAHGDDAHLQGDVGLTAFVVRALARVGESSPRSEAWLAVEAPRIEDPYGQALAALAFLEGDPKHVVGRLLVERLVEAASEDDDGPFWGPATTTCVGGRGASGEYETSALVIQALLLEGRHMPLAWSALERLVAKRNQNGYFGTTQATVRALEALLAADDGTRVRPGSEVRVTRGGSDVALLELASDATVPAQADLAAGEGDPTLVLDGEGKARASVTRTHWAAWKDAPKVSGRLALDVRWPLGSLRVGNHYAAEVEIRNVADQPAQTVTLEIGLPPGITAEAKDLRGEGFAYAERGERTMVIYLEDLPVGEARTFRIPFRVRYGFEVLTAPSKAYEYYVPEEAAWVAPVRLSSER